MFSVSAHNVRSSSNIPMTINLTNRRTLSSKIFEDIRINNENYNENNIALENNVAAKE